MVLPDALTVRLQELASARHLTLNVLVQGAWALALARNGASGDEVLFGMMTSGRPAELPDVERIDDLHVGKAIKKDDALHDAIGMAHFFHRFRPPFSGEGAIAPVFEQPIMQPVLVDGGKLVPQPTIEIFDDAGVASHLRDRVSETREKAHSENPP